MRVRNSIKNVFVSVLMSVITLVVGFISQKIFVTTLGTEYLGLNSLFSNILSILSVVELGFGTAIIFNLYKPVADNDKVKITVLLNFYKKAYQLIACIIFVLGLLFLPFLNSVVGKTNISNIHILFFLSLLEVVLSYMLTYKRSILYANQKNYIINIIHIAYILLLNSLQIIFLLCTENYIIYLIIKIIFRVLENIFITMIANRMYPYIKEKNDKKIDDDLKNSIVNKVRGLLFHNIGGALVQGTDNIIISKMFSVVTVGLYSNYYMITNSLNNLMTQLFQSLTSSVGNLLIEKNENKSYVIYKNLLFFNSWVYCLTGAVLLCVMEPFIKVWMGNEYVLPYSVLILIVINYYIQGMRKTNSVFKNAAGIFYEDRYVPIIEALLNIIFSIIFGKLFGLSGIFLGTILSSIILFLYSYPIYIYKKIFNKKYCEFIFDNLKHIVISFVFLVIVAFLCNKINIGNLYLEILIRGIGSAMLICLMYLIVFYKSTEFNYYLDILRNLLRRKNEK